MLQPEQAPPSEPEIAALFRSILPYGVFVHGGPIAAPLTTLFDSEYELVRSAVTKRQREFAAGRHYAHLALASAGFRPAPIHPAPDRGPIWPSDIVGSISHTDYCAVAAVASASILTALGIDLEHRVSLAPNVIALIADRDERALWNDNKLPIELRDSTAPLTFSAKEAVFKAYYPKFRRRISFGDIQIRYTGVPSRFCVQAPQLPDPDQSFLASVEGRFAITTNYIATVALVLRCT
ncbi:4'-phosphopantetheinyl transferase family protein [Bradyrhizobium prioriisuperbiae]|uniref:4'-phosphopantetheinyl transferase family protein n=1 Tax=Bradyrhizobium prioriisuperbiae TaxID=2854389 RepID=UPI003899614E